MNRPAVFLDDLLALKLRIVVLLLPCQPLWREILMKMGRTSMGYDSLLFLAHSKGEMALQVELALLAVYLSRTV